jgi:hypothetical protein
MGRPPDTLFDNVARSHQREHPRPRDRVRQSNEGRKRPKRLRAGLRIKRVHAASRARVVEELLDPARATATRPAHSSRHLSVRTSHSSSGRLPGGKRSHQRHWLRVSSTAAAAPRLRRTPVIKSAGRSPAQRAAQPVGLHPRLGDRLEALRAGDHHATDLGLEEASALPVASSATRSVGARLSANSCSASGLVATRPADRTRPSSQTATSRSAPLRSSCSCRGRSPDRIA